MPECLSYIFHNMAYELHGLLAGNVSVRTGENIRPSNGGDDEAFLKKVITPIYRVIDKEAKKGKHEKAPHSDWCNYDDLNGYIWSADCLSLGWPSVMMMSSSSQHGKHNLQFRENVDLKRLLVKASGNCFRFREHVVWTDKLQNFKILRKSVLTRIYAPMSIIQGLREAGTFISTSAYAHSHSKKSFSSSTEDQQRKTSSHCNN